jgi:hypothetical protein
MTITTAGNTPTGASTITVTGTAGANTKTTSFTLTVTPGSTKFSVGSQAQVSLGPLNVRSCAGTSCSVLGKQSTIGTLATVIGGPLQANSFWWWQLDYESGADGWSAEPFLVASTTTIPAFGQAIPEQNQSRESQIAGISAALEAAKGALMKLLAQAAGGR